MKNKIISITMTLLGLAIMINDIFDINFSKSAIKANLNPIKGQINKGDSLIFSLGLLIFFVGIIVFASGGLEPLPELNSETKNEAQGITDDIGRNK